MLPPAYYGLVSPEILSTIKDIDAKRLYYGPKASLLLTCRLDEFVNDLGFPMPEVDVELQGIDDISSVTGVISWGDTRVISEGVGASPGPITRSQSVSTVSSLSPSANDTQVYASASLDRS